MFASTALPALYCMGFQACHSEPTSQSQQLPGVWKLAFCLISASLASTPHPLCPGMDKESSSQPTSSSFWPLLCTHSTVCGHGHPSSAELVPWFCTTSCPSCLLGLAVRQREFLRVLRAAVCSRATSRGIGSEAFAFHFPGLFRLYLQFF